ncbi:MAG: hypothetical protein ABI462_07385 [Ignavibacteria bacterium]
MKTFLIIFLSCLLFIYFFNVNLASINVNSSGIITDRNILIAQDNNPGSAESLFPPCDDFSSVTFPTAPLSIEFTGTNYWSRNSVSAYGIGTGSAKFDFFNAPDGTVQSLVADFAPVPPSNYLTFDQAYASLTGSLISDTLVIQGSNNSGSSYFTLATLIGNADGTGEINTAPSTAGQFTPSGSQWRPKIYLLPNATNRIRIMAKGGAGNNLYIDNICVQFLPNGGILDIGCTMQGFYRGTPSAFYGVADTIRTYIHRADQPDVIVDSAIAFMSPTCFFTANFPRALSGTYYLVMKQRNSIETWSYAGGLAYTRGIHSNFDFLQFNSAYSNNQFQVNPGFNFWGMFGGDIDQNGIVNLNDITLVFNDATAFATGYVRTDVTGNNITDLNDIVLTYNNNINFVSVKKP